MSKSVTLSIVTNTLIAGSKAFGWFATGSPTLFAETVHSIADVANQTLLKVGEVRAAGGADALHPLGRGQERFFWALVSAVSIFFVGAGVTIYHGIHSLLEPEAVEAFTPLAIGLLLFSLVLELFTFFTALKEIGGLAGVRANRSNTSVLAVLLEDAVAVAGILLTLLVAGGSMLFGHNHVLDASVSIVVGLMLGTMALFLANVNRRMLIDVAEPSLDEVLRDSLVAQGVDATVASVTVDVDRYVVMIGVQGAVPGHLPRSHEIGEQLKGLARQRLGKAVEAVYWRYLPEPRKRP